VQGKKERSLRSVSALMPLRRRENERIQRGHPRKEREEVCLERDLAGNDKTACRLCRVGLIPAVLKECNRVGAAKGHNQA